MKRSEPARRGSGQGPTDPGLLARPLDFISEDHLRERQRDHDEVHALGAQAERTHEKRIGRCRAEQAGLDKTQLLQWLQQGVSQLNLTLPLSHLQCLYASPDDQLAFREAGFIERFDVQFLWSNQGFQHLDDFLAVLTARKRKQIRKERAAVAEQGVVLKTLSGADLDLAFWQQFYGFYCDTYQKRSRHNGYLTADTFWRWGQTMAKQIVVFAAFVDDQMVIGFVVHFVFLCQKVYYY